jgi:hypothetical protein
LSRWSARFAEALHDGVVARSGIAAITDPLGERSKLDAVRIVAGAIMFYRFLAITCAAHYYYGDSGSLPAEFVVSAAMTVLVALFTIGLFTPIVTALLLATLNTADTVLLTQSLGSTIFTLLLWIFLLAGSGTTHSADAWLARTRLGRPFRWLYARLTVPDERQLRLYYFLVFVAFALINLGAVLHHLSDAYWVRGQTMAVILTNSYLSKFYVPFRRLEQAGPVLPVISATLIVIQTGWQLFMIPLSFSRWGNRLVIAWGLAFFIGSMILLQLSVLAYVQLLLWVVLFDRARGEARAGLEVRCREPAVTGVLAAAAFFGLFVFVLQLPLFPRTRLQHPLIRSYLYRIGLQFPVVFNQSDLALGDKWYLLTRVTASGAREIVPFYEADGRRGWYHFSDLLYFGNSVRWRRHGIAHDPVEFNSPGMDGYDKIMQVVRFDARLHRAARPVAYEVDVYRNRSSDVDAPAADRYRPEKVLSFVIPFPVRAN